MQRRAGRLGLDLEPSPPAGLVLELARQQDYDHEPDSTERMGGSWLAASSQPSAWWPRMKTEPLWVPK